jgi:hypothetical protein
MHNPRLIAQHYMQCFAPRIPEPIATPARHTGVNAASNVGTAKPVKPANEPSTSTAHSPQPRCAISSRCRKARASLCSRVRVAGKYRMTSPSRFITANGSSSLSFHCRKETAIAALTMDWTNLRKRHEDFVARFCFVKRAGIVDGIGCLCPAVRISNAILARSCEGRGFAHSVILALKVRLA